MSRVCLVEFCCPDGSVIESVYSPAVPRAGELVNIDANKYIVKGVSWGITKGHVWELGAIVDVVRVSSGL